MPVTNFFPQADFNRSYVEAIAPTIWYLLALLMAVARVRIILFFQNLRNAALWG
ncbi:hypothetical protein [Phormidium nigroviride]